jgi:hypothetical protein
VNPGEGGSPYRYALPFSASSGATELPSEAEAWSDYGAKERNIGLSEATDGATCER